MTNQTEFEKMKKLQKIVEKLNQEKVKKQNWVDLEYKEKKEVFQDKMMIEIWLERITEIDLEIESLEIIIKMIDVDFKAEAQRKI